MNLLHEYFVRAGSPKILSEKREFFGKPAPANHELNFIRAEGLMMNDRCDRSGTPSLEDFHHS